MVDPVSQIITGLGGMGLGVLVMWKWLDSEREGRKTDKAESLATISGLQTKLDKSEERDRATSKQVIEALLLNKKILEEHQDDLEKHFSDVIQEVRKIENLLRSASHEPD